MAAFAALGFAYADVLRQPYVQLTPTCKTLRLTICVQVLQKQRKMPSENPWGAQAAFRLSQPYASAGFWKGRFRPWFCIGFPQDLLAFA